MNRVNQTLFNKTAIDEFECLWQEVPTVICVFSDMDIQQIVTKFTAVKQRVLSFE